MKRKLFLYILLIFNCGLSFAQGPNNDNPFPSIIPPSPELASLANIAEIDAKNYTGAATVQIPLYDLKVGSLSAPIALHYGTNGIRVNDIPTRVGLGWNLIAGGSINKIVHDEEDDNPLTHHLQAGNVWSVDEALSTYLFYANMEHYDTERDEYSYNVNGLSGKFFIDDNGVPQFADKSSVQITRSVSGSFVLTDGMGTKYYFGAVREITSDVKLNGQTRGNVQKTTGYFLTKIVSQEGDEINYDYNSIHIRSYMGSSQSVILRLNTDPSYSANPLTDCGFCAFYSPFVVNGSYNQVDYDTYYLSSISASNGVTATFNYVTRGDETSDKRLAEIYVNDNSSANQVLIKKYLFEYDNYPISGEQQLRYFLKKIVTVSTFTSGSNPAEQLDHTFTYYHPESLPSQRDFSQDYFGYSNGRGNLYFWPKPLGFEDYQFGSEGGNRDPHFEDAVSGALQKVVYPTGGSQEFIYEAHTMQTEQFDSTFSISNLSTPGTGLDLPVTATRNITIGNTSSEVRINYITHQNPAGPSYGQQGYWEAGDGKTISSLEIKNSNGVTVWQTHHLENTISTFYVSLGLNQTYTVVLTVKGASYLSDVELRYNKVLVSHMINTPGCGIRVKQIRSYEPVTNKYSSKYYTYAKLDDLIAFGPPSAVTCAAITGVMPQHIFLSTGVGQLATVDADFYPKGGFCESNSSHNIIQSCTQFIRVGSSSINGVHTFGGSPIAYSNIIESDDPNFLHGGIEHTYNTSFLNENVLPILNYPSRSYLGFENNLEGKEIKTRIFKNSGNNYIILKEDESIFSGDSRINAIVYNYVTSKRYDPPPKDDIFSWADVLKAYDIGGYVLMAGWSHLDSKISTTYDENGQNPLIQRVDYTYNNIDHCQPTQITTTNSKGETITQNLKYPIDFTTGIYPEMVSHNIITPVIEQTNENSTYGLIAKTKTTYDRWTNPNTTLPDFYKPLEISTAKGYANPSIKVHFDSYAANGRTLKLSKENGISTTYLWNYQNSVPVAEITNALATDSVAYTSFEANDHGGWDYSNIGISDEYSITGTRCYSGSIGKHINAAEKYIVTSWGRNVITVNGLNGSSIVTKRGWTLYKWVIEHTSDLKVEGSLMDEVRLIPANAKITTYTYFPEIGISSTCDDNNNIQYYEYDGFNRLVLVRDIDLNILKQNEYKYSTAIQPCPNSSPDWQLSGNTRCVQSSLPGLHHNYTGQQEEERVDRNGCSPTYLQSQWTLLSTTSPGQCQPVANCTGIDQMVVNGVCTTGTKVLITSSCVNGVCTCSFRYVWCDGTHSEIFTETNSTACPNTIVNPD